MESAWKTGAVVTAEEHMVNGGLGSAVSEILVEHCPVPLKRIGVRDTFGSSGKPENLLIHYGLTAEDIKYAALKVIARKSDNLSTPVLEIPAATTSGRKSL